MFLYILVHYSRLHLFDRASRSRYARQIKQLQEREAFLEGNCQQLERDIRRLEEQLVAVQSESESKAHEAAEAKMAGLRQKVTGSRISR